jgi:hypothetical protein
LVDKISLISTDADEYIWSTDIDWSNAKAKWSDRYVYSEFVKIGKNVRTAIENNKLKIYNKFTNDFISEYDILGQPLSLAIRNVDDMIAILIKKDENFLIDYINPVEDTTNTQNIKEFITFESASIKFSKMDSNVIYTSNLKQFQMRSIINGEYPFSFLDEENLLYPKDLKFGEAFSKYYGIKRKWNTKVMKSNNFNNILVDDQHSGSDFILFLHNIGRIYALKSPSVNTINANLPLSLKKMYNNVSISETSFGKYLNSNLRKIVEDLLTLYQKASKTYSYTPTGVNENIIKFLQIDIENFYMQGNETFNVITFRRIIENIVDLQKTLISKTITLNN